MDSIPTVSNAVYGMHVYPTKIPSPNDNGIPATITNPTYELVKPPLAASHLTHTTAANTSTNDDQNHYEYARYTFATTIQEEPNSMKKSQNYKSNPIYMNMMSTNPEKPCVYENVNF